MQVPSIDTLTETDVTELLGKLAALREEIGKVIVGHNDVVEGVLTAIVAGGHVLLEGVPGLGKTRLVESLADVLDVSFQRIPFTPDLMPSDLIGTFVVMETPQGRRTFEFQKGPLFSHVVLAPFITTKSGSKLSSSSSPGRMNMFLTK